MDDCHPERAAETTSRGDTPLAGRHFYARKATPREEFLTAVTVGSEDLEASRLRCSLFFMASCSSHVHFYRPLARRRRRTGSKCRFLLTGNICATAHGATFLREVLVERRDPATATGRKALVKALNGQKNSGLVGLY
jgi:hypothetical protein